MPEGGFKRLVTANHTSGGITSPFNLLETFKLRNDPQSTADGTGLRGGVQTPDVPVSPEAVQHRAVRMQADHAVLHGDAVDEGLLVVQEVGVGHPELVRHAVVQRQVQGDLRVGQALVPPRLLEVHGQGVVLGDGGGGRGGGRRRLVNPDTDNTLKSKPHTRNHRRTT